ncbi:hypothetical protein SUNI508_12468 [Seiridium unicorne]|uniref:Uncharacterized protein n=1 Tax=Seiridium unicorne TaxID=138068 RepID=A0ABR2VGX7_9PEZI
MLNPLALFESSRSCKSQNLALIISDTPPGCASPAAVYPTLSWAAAQFRTVARVALWSSAHRAQTFAHPSEHGQHEGSDPPNLRPPRTVSYARMHARSQLAQMSIPLCHGWARPIASTNT